MILLRPDQKYLWLIVLLALPGWAKACDYNRTAATLMQCRPVDLTESDQITAKIVCACDYALVQPDSHCVEQITEHSSFVIETTDIRQTCGQGSNLCAPACADRLN